METKSSENRLMGGFILVYITFDEPVQGETNQKILISCLLEIGQ